MRLAGNTHWLWFPAIVAAGVGLHGPITRAEQPADDAVQLPPVEERAAALKTIEASGGRVQPDIEKLLAAGVQDFRNLKHRFVVGQFSRVAITDELFNALAAFPEIERLFLSQSGITDEQLGRLRLPNLKYLDLSDTPITDRGLEQLWSLKKLEYLDLARTAVTGAGLKTLVTLTNLKSVTLDQTAVDDAGMAFLAKLPKLDSLSLYRTGVGDTGLARLRTVSSLTLLDLRETLVTDAGLESLDKLPMLEGLFLDGTAIGDRGIDAIKGLRNINRLTLDGTKVTDVSAATLASWTNLTLLRLHGNALTDRGVEQLHVLVNLRHLDLSGTKITDAALRALAKMRELELLNLADTAITDVGLAELKPLLALRQLNLSGTNISDPRFQALKALPRLKVDVAGTKVTGLDVFRAFPQSSPNVQATTHALDEPTEVDVKNISLHNVLDYFSARHNLLIQTDSRSLDRARVDAFKPQITASLRGIALREALARILDPLGLTFAVRHEVLWIGDKPLTEKVSDLPEIPPGTRLSPKVAVAFMKPCSVKFREQPLDATLKDLGQQCGIELEIDLQSLKKAGIPPNCPITRQVRGVTLKSTLELLLDELDLTCIADGDRAIIRVKGDR